MQKIHHFIHGEKRPPVKGEFLENKNPATGQTFSLLARGSAGDIESAVESAERAFARWSILSAEERAKYLNKIADRIEARKDEFAKLESLDQGKPLWLAKEMDIARAVHNFRFFAHSILHHENESTHPDAHTHNFVLRKPVGIAGLISPWNLPLYLLTWKIAPALAAGNTVICKPSELTSMTADLLADVCLEVGLPPGVVNLVYGLGPEAGEALVRHPKVPLISFTGGTQTGRHILSASAEHFKKVSLELGGKNPNLIFADCDLKAAVKASIRSSFLNQGEICLCGSRIYVEEKIADEFTKLFVEETKKLKVGPPDQVETWMGPLVSEAHLKKVKSYLEIAQKDGGRVLAGGDAPQMLPPYTNGYWLNPTILTDLPETSACVKEEIFGPVVTLSTFRNDDEALEKANAVKFGLSASIWTENNSRIHRFSRDLQVGTLWVNCWLVRDLRLPFGGMKQSGVGREGGKHSLDFFTEATTVCVRF